MRERRREREEKRREGDRGQERGIEIGGGDRKRCKNMLCILIKARLEK